MDDELTVFELHFCCPECHCSQWYSVDGETLYGCLRCDYVCDFPIEIDECYPLEDNLIYE